jgi:hypothetical protein
VTFRGKEFGDIAKHLLTGGSVGLGAALGYFLMSATGDERKLLIETVAKFGPWFVMGIAGIVFVDRRVGEGINVLKDNAISMKENAVSNQKLADAVSMIANRDDSRAREQELAMDVMVGETRKIHEKLDELMGHVRKENGAMSAGA